MCKDFDENYVLAFLIEHIEREAEKVCLEQSGLFVRRKCAVLRNECAVTENLLCEAKMRDYKTQRLIFELRGNSEFGPNPDVMAAFAKSVPEIVHTFVLERLKIGGVFHCIAKS